MRWTSALIAAALTLAACSKHHERGAAPAHSAPWRARPAPESPRPHLVVRYVIEPRGRASFSLKAKKATPTGALRVARGELQVDLLDLSQTRGNVRMDLASVMMDADPDAGDAGDATRQARDWLDVGDSQPEAARARKRWARFSIESIDHTSAGAAYEGRRVKPSALSPEAGTARDAASGGSPDLHEVRSVDLIATGNLLVHGFRVERSVRLRALFEFRKAATAGARPDRIVIRSRRPFLVSLRAHDIKPRDPEGVFVSKAMKLLGVQVGREARVSLDLAAVPFPVRR